MSSDREELVLFSGFGTDDFTESAKLTVEYRRTDNRGLVVRDPYFAVKIGDSEWYPLDDINIAAKALKERTEK